MTHEAKPNLKTDYTRFDADYRRLRAEGRSGWVYGDDWDFHLSWLDKALSASYSPASGRALELGCGAGCWCVVLARRGFQTTGVDLSPQAIEWASEKARTEGLPIEFRRANVLQMADWQADTFDFILDGFCLHCLIGPDRGVFLRSAARLLKPGGLFYVRTWCAEDIQSEHWRDWIDPHTRCSIEDGVATRYVGDPDEILDELRQAGLNLLHHEIAPWGGGMLQVHATKQ